MELLISSGADVNAKDKHNSTPLHAAVIFGTPKMVEMLIANGANVNAQQNYHTTPLHIIATLGYSDDLSDRENVIAKLLIDNGADVNLKNWQDKTPLDLAIENVVTIGASNKSKFIIVFFFLNSFY